MTNYEKMVSVLNIQKPIAELAEDFAKTTNCSECPARKQCYTIRKITCRETIQEWLNRSA